MKKTETKNEKIKFSKIKYSTVPIRWVVKGELRLDASFYTKEVFKAIKVLEECGFPLTKISELCEPNGIFNPPPLRRYFTYSPDVGTPYLAPSETLKLKPKEKYIYAQKVEGIEDWYVKEGWVLVTQSGIPGIPVFVSKRIKGIVISQNMIRIVPKAGILPGFIYAYLSTWIGNTLVTKDQFGITVDHIRPHHVAEIPVPLVPDNVKRKIHEKIVRAWNLRDQADEIEKEAIKELEIFLAKEIE